MGLLSILNTRVASGSPSRYGGIAAVLVLGVGLLLVGKFTAGVAALAIGLVVLGFVIWPDLLDVSAVFAIAALGVTLLLVYYAVHNEITGTANYYSSLGKHSKARPVTRAQSPEKFRIATNIIWAGAMGVALVGTMVYRVQRKAEDWDLDI